MRDTGAKAWRPRVLTLVVGENSPLEILSLSASRMAYLAPIASALSIHWSTNLPGVVGWNTVGSGILVRFALKTARGPGMCGGSIGAGTETKVNIV